MYRNADKIEKLKKIKEDSDREAASMLRQLKTLSESRDSMQRQLVELKEVRDEDEPLTLAGRLRRVLGLSRGLFPTLPAST